MSARCEREIKAYEAVERQEPSSPGATIFVGDSTLRLWRSMPEDLKPVKVINRGLGGATLDDCLVAIERLVVPVNPGRVILYCGENDIVAGKKPNLILGQIRDFFCLCREGVGHVEGFFVSLKLSPARKKNWQVIKEINRAVKEWALEKEEINYVDFNSLMLEGRDEPPADLFVTNGTHLSYKGYELLASLTRNTILK